MSQPDTTLAVLIAQYHQLAPLEVTATLPTSRKPRTHTYHRAIFDNAKGTVHFDYIARKRRGAYLADKIRVSVTYNVRLDLYEVEVIYCDGLDLTAEPTPLLTWGQAFWSDFGTLPTHYDIQPQPAAAGEATAA
jgi:hypothetical protein